MMPALRSELLRLRRRSVLLGWFGLTAVFAVLINTVLYANAATSSSAAARGPGVVFPPLAVLQAPEGLVAGLGSASSILGVVTLSFWALTTATDYSTGLIRVLVAAQPQRWRLLVGKVAALAAATVAATTVALVANILAAPVWARAAGVATQRWSEHPASTVMTGWLHLYLALLVWGVLGLALAVTTRSAAVAISTGVGYVLVVETVVASAVTAARDWLPGSTLTALAQGGTATVAYPRALLLGVLYTGGAMTFATLLVNRRDVTD